MCDNNCTWVFNLLVVTLLIQHVVHVARAGNEHISVSLVKRDIVDGIEDDNFASGKQIKTNFDNEDFDSDIEFSAYANDFNMQDEASIPEDILDQQHIKDDDGAIDADMQYSDSDAVDMILNSQRSYSTKLHSYDDSTTQNKKHDNYYRNHYKKDFDKKDIDDDVATISTESKYDGSVETKKIRGLHDLKNSWLRKQQQDQQSEQMDQKLKEQQQQQQQQQRQQKQQQIEAIEKLNGRKFNKASLEQNKKNYYSDSNNNNSNNNNNKKKNNNDNNNNNKNNNNNYYNDNDNKHKIKVNIEDDIKMDKSAIGDIEENVRNEDEALSNEEQHENTETEVDKDEYIAEDTTVKVATTQVTTTTTTTRMPATKATATSNVGNTKKLTNFITRKNKRHGSPRTFNSGDRTPRNYEDMHYGHQRYTSKEDSTNENNDEILREKYRAQVHATSEEPKVQTDYSISYFGILTNDTNVFDFSKDGRRFNKQPETRNDEGHKQFDELEPGRSILGESATVPPATSAMRTQSAFEQHKAQRRNNRRNGHKSHKKKYKDYLRYAVTMSPTATVSEIRTTASAIHTNNNIADAIDDKTATAADTMPTVNAVIVKFINNTKHNNQQQSAAQLNEKHKNYSKKIEAEKLRGLPASPVFVVNSNRNKVTGNERASKPFYEGQINYYVETKDDDDEAAAQTEVDNKYKINGKHADNEEQRQLKNMDNNSDNWYRRTNPVLRNGIKTTYAEQKQSTDFEQQEQHKNHHRLHHHHQHHRNHHKHHQHSKAHQSAQANPYQRKLLPTAKKSSYNHQSSSSTKVTQTPIPPPAYKQHTGAMQELGHQITEMEEFERYYAKWPHLARVQFQVYDEHYREMHPDLYPEYDYESAAELEEAQNSKSEDADLPPYIKKYNRRNKQLLNLLEGTLPPTTRLSPMFTWSNSKLQPGPHDSSSTGAVVVRIDDDYMKEKRRRYHNHMHNNNKQQKDLFSQQRNEAPQILSTTESNAIVLGQQNKIPVENHLPEEDITILQEHNDDIWQKEIETKSNGNEMTGSEQMTWQIEKLTTTLPPTTTTLKAAIFKLPSYPAILGSFISKPRSRSAQFAPSTGSRGNSIINSSGYSFDSGNYKAKSRYTPLEDSNANVVTSTSAPAVAVAGAEAEAGASDGIATTTTKAINSFVYHRVVDASPRLVGAGSTGRKQRLPFVAITDRRLETSKKSLLERQKDFEQNYFPMP
ncbi:putative uncharacterized protein DDB_G0282133 [Teleopsis dalmanni]|uniref:putative uncharacterized protein DDB_G0282133 n=1 Tax=Teleopsis dalmanni TaxID=139649 RepID=UPI0018CFCF3E|nr:putative uncharacterized protein DDB_G0282133 [Teleopsis dalmanni]